MISDYYDLYEIAKSLSYAPYTKLSFFLKNILTYDQPCGII